jgi:hypothetical protein
MPTHSNMNQSKQMANIPADQRPSGTDPGRGADSGERKENASDQAPGASEPGRTREQQQGGQPSPELKDKDAPKSDSNGDTRDSGEPASR